MGLKKTSRLSASGRKIPKRVKESKQTNNEKKDEKEKGNVQQCSVKKGQSKMTLCTTSSIQARPTRRPGRPPSGKSSVGLQRQKEMSLKVRSSYRRNFDACDNSNDSGLGFGDHQMDPQHQHQHHQHHNHHRLNGGGDRVSWTNDRTDAKRQKIDVKLEHDEANDSYCFPENVLTSKDNLALLNTTPTSSVSSLSMSSTSSTNVRTAVPRNTGVIPLTAQLMATSRYTNVSLQIIKQPEQQHRARYQTEGSRGAVKDREGNGFPVVQLVNYYQPATLQVYIGTDTGRISPHIFYQACKVSGKNSTPCTETKIEGTCVIELQLDPSKDMRATCDCVGILKERNVDVEHRFPDQLGNRPKKKSTKCRMIFRTTITLEDGNRETLQVCSQPIVCTQPPGIPEISKKSLTSCPASGGLELFVLGKNFLKDTRVFFQQYEENHVRWEHTVVPDKEYLQQTHFVCVVPPYRRLDITEPVSVRLCVVSSGKTSETHQFVYTPINGVASVMVDPAPTLPPPTFFKSNFWQSNVSISKREQDLDMMPPPESSLVPISTRRPSVNLPSTSDSNHSPPQHPLKQEYVDESSQNPIVEHQERYRHLSESSLDAHHGDSNMSMINENSMMSHINDNSNISVGNEDSIDLVRAGCTKSNLSSMNEDSTCSTSLQSGILPEQSTGMDNVMDLRMKLPMVTVADLVNTTAPSIAALQRFGIMEHPSEPLPNQSAQSVENYLNKIEAKPSMIPLTNPTGLLMKNDLSQMINTRPSMFAATKESSIQDCGLMNVREALFPSSTRPFMSSRSQSDLVNMVSKSESADVPDQTLPEQTNTIASSTITTVSTVLERSVPTPINTERLDALVNSTVESHLSPTRSGSLVSTPTLNTQPNLALGVLGPADLTNQPPEVILNSQLPPTLMCQTSVVQENPVSLVALTTEPEKVVLLNAAVDLLETQQQLNNFGGTSTGSGFVTQNDKSKTQNVDRMIPQDFPSLTENELINLINPSCFDQV